MTESKHSKILIAYFSRTGEQYSVGNITEGNTAIIAKIIADKPKIANRNGTNGKKLG